MIFQVKLAIKPKVETNDPFYDPTTQNINRLRDICWARRWPGKRWLVAEPINNREQQS